MTRLVPLILGAVLTSACWTPRFDAPNPDVEETALEESGDAEATVSRIHGYEERVMRVGWLLRVAAAPLCEPDTGPGLGYRVSRLHDDQRQSPYWRAWAERYGIGAGVTITRLVPDGPMSRAGIHAGDELVAIGDTRIDNINGMIRLRRVMRDAKAGDALTVEVAREGRRISAEVATLPVCRPPIELGFSGAMVTYTDPYVDDIRVNTGLLDFLESDDELAVVLGHEIGHTVVGDRGEQTELLADEVGLYLATATGFDPRVAAPFWKRWAIERPWSLRARTELDLDERYHDDVARRLPAMRAMADALVARRDTGRPLELPRLDPETAH